MKIKLESTIAFRVPTATREQIAQIAAREDRQPSYILRRCIQAGLAQERAQERSQPTET